MMNADLLIGKARESIKKMESGTVFVAKDLFEGYEWNELLRGEKLCFGRRFKEDVLECKFAGVKYKGKRANNSAEYIKE